MPRAAQGARLWLRREAGRAPQYYIVDRGKRIALGLGPGETEQASQELARYIKGRALKEGRGIPPHEFPVLDALTIYAEDAQDRVVSTNNVRANIRALAPFFREHSVDDIDDDLCKAYARQRYAAGRQPNTVRRELNTLSAALNVAVRKRRLKHAPKIWRPKTKRTKFRWLTQAEAARFVWEARRARKTYPKNTRGLPHWRETRHLAYFILFALYTGTRKDAILTMQWQPNKDGGWVDLENRIIYRLPEEGEQTNKRRTPIPIPDKLYGHLRRLRGVTDTHVIEYRGRPVKSIYTAWRKVLERSGIEFCTPHDLRRTAITWSMQAGGEINEKIQFYGVSREVLEDVYWQFHPDYLKGATEIASRRRTQ